MAQGPEKPLCKIEAGAPFELPRFGSGSLGPQPKRGSAREGLGQSYGEPAPAAPPTIVFGGFAGLEFKVRVESLGLGFEVWGLGFWGLRFGFRMV